MQPLRCRICCEVDLDKNSAIKPDDDEGMEQFEANGRDNEQVHGNHVRHLIAQKCLPSLALRPASSYHVLGDTRLREPQPELEQFPMDARRSSKRVLDAYPPN